MAGLPLPTDYAPMEAKLVDTLPVGETWRYEPKWDGFRCLAFRYGDDIELRSKAGQPFNRYFPEMVAALRTVAATRFVLDGELVVPVGEVLSFDELLMRIHPAESRVRKLAETHPVLYVVFDLLVDEEGASLVGEPLDMRRRSLEAFALRHASVASRVRLSPQTRDVDEVETWFRDSGGGLDGIVAKRGDLAYRSGERTGMQKFKYRRTAECVVGGFRYGAKGREVGSLLLGLYDATGVLHHVGFAANIRSTERAALTERLEQLRSPPGFTGRAPGGPSRWSTERSGEWEPLAPVLVAEVEYDYWNGERFRHGTKFLRWRPDKPPDRCTLAQVEQEAGSSLALLTRPARRTRAARSGPG